MNKTMLCCLSVALLALAGNIARAQPVIVYQMGETNGNYLLSYSYRRDQVTVVSQIVIFEGLTVKSDESVCHLVLSNAFLFQTSAKRLASPQVQPEVEQFRAKFEQYSIDLLCDTKVIFDGAVTNVASFKLSLPGQHGPRKPSASKPDERRTYDELLKKLELNPPDDADVSPESSTKRD